MKSEGHYDSTVRPDTPFVFSRMLQLSFALNLNLPLCFLWYVYAMIFYRGGGGEKIVNTKMLLMTTFG